MKLPLFNWKSERQVIRKLRSGTHLLNLLKLIEKSIQREAYKLFYGWSFVVTLSNMTLPMAARFEFIFPILYLTSYFNTCP